MTAALNNAFMRLQRRAEGSAPQKLVDTFVDVGSLFTLLSSIDHQVVYGRRGTGKTHALIYLRENRRYKGDAVAYIDLRNIGSNGGLYADTTLPLAERATRLLMDVLLAVHEDLLPYFLNHAEEFDLSTTGPLLDEFASAASQVYIEGPVELTEAHRLEAEERQQSSATVGFSADGPSAELSTQRDSGRKTGQDMTVQQRGNVRIKISFGTVAAIIKKLALTMKKKRIWILFDEWSSVPAALQPFLADFLRRSLFPSPSLTVKIAAIEQRSHFRIELQRSEYIGFELGADITADVNLDDFMVFDNDAKKATEFFANLVFKHILGTEEVNASQLPENTGELIRQGFTQANTFEEFVRAAEGVPRDAINIISLAAQHASDDNITKEHIRRAAQRWYERDKRAAVSKKEARDLLHWIIDEVIGKRKARAFLIKADVRDPLIDYLFDARVLHLLKRSVSTHDEAGVRYDVYKLDYGCYVDLISTAKAAAGDFNTSPDESQEPQYTNTVDVPGDDYRAIRRAILDMDNFYKRNENTPSLDG